MLCMLRTPVESWLAKLSAFTGNTRHYFNTDKSISLIGWKRDLFQAHRERGEGVRSLVPRCLHGDVHFVVADKIKKWPLHTGYFNILEHLHACVFATVLFWRSALIVLRCVILSLCVSSRTILSRAVLSLCRVDAVLFCSCMFWRHAV